MDEKELILKAKAGDSASLEKLMSEYKKLVTKISRKYFIIGAELNDVIQEGMIGLFNAYSSFDVNKNVQFKTYASICINRQIISAIKKAYKYSKDDLMDDLNISEINANTIKLSPEEQYIIEEDYKSLQGKIKEVLSIKELNILSKFLQNKSYEEISNELNLTKKSVDNALTRIRTKLKFLIK
ncbi:MAG: sigma-70 family RNA polymerase sigma factor [Christensenellales bacterium]